MSFLCSPSIYYTNEAPMCMSSLDLSWVMSKLPFFHCLCYCYSLSLLTVGLLHIYVDDELLLYPLRIYIYTPMKIHMHVLSWFPMGHVWWPLVVHVHWPLVVVFANVFAFAITGCWFCLDLAMVMNNGPWLPVTVGLSLLFLLQFLPLQ